MPPQMPSGGWSKEDLDAIGRIEMPVEEQKSGLGHSGRFKPGGVIGDGIGDELKVSQRVHRPDPELSASGKFIAAEIAAAGGYTTGAGPNFDPRSLLEAPPAKKPADPVVIGCLVVALLLLGWGGFQVASYLMSSGPSEVNAAANEIRMGNDDVADTKLRGVLKEIPTKRDPHEYHCEDDACCVACGPEEVRRSACFVRRDFESGPASRRCLSHQSCGARAVREV
jgi:hypothetical protein